MLLYIITCSIALIVLVIGVSLSKETPRIDHIVLCLAPILNLIVILAAAIYLFDAIFKRTGPCKWNHDFQLESEYVSRAGRASRYKCTRCNDKSFKKEQYI